MKNTEPWLEQLTRAFVKANGIAPSATDEPAIVGAKREVITDVNTGQFLSKATILFKGSEGNYRGGQLINFKTVNLEELFINNTVPTVWGYNPHNTREVAQLLVDQYGLSVDTDWFKLEPFDASVLPTHVTLTLENTAFSASSQLTVAMERVESDIATRFANNVLGDLALPYDPMYQSNTVPSYSKDFTPAYPDQKIWFTSLVKDGGSSVGTAYKYTDLANGAEFVAYLNSVLDGDITLDVSASTVFGKPNIYYFYVRYNGSTKGAIYNGVSADTQYDKVLIIEPFWGKTYTGCDGALFLHYNDV